MKLISQLKSGDQILTIDQTNIISTDFILMLDQHSQREGIFYFI